ncbi:MULTISPECIES: type II secretion system F family protein [unclassified Streptomyces]|uniref:type II secretion system F family protein n=1 Tax=unclassified Streptomyces TaxID=2593676 RepID=UPI001904BC24|nr:MULTISPECIES: type II secretion system F family protein [unclassified Streptomyces]MCU4748066.1 type II secretion system F family protein [Streptomyces sp. G-5]QQN78668.1 type II secretion system F family protein [Streptomyces sp. XC 2026]
MDEYLMRLAPFVVALCAGAAAWLLVTAAPSRGRRVRAVLEGGRPDRAERRRRRWRVRPGPPAEGTARVLLWCLTAGGLLSLWGRSVLPLIAAGLAAPVVLRWWRRRQERRDADRRREAVIDFCRSVAAEVRAGRQPCQALAATGVSGFGGAGSAILAAARYGGDVPRALSAAADRPGAEGLRGVAACWRVAVDSGASLALGLEKVARALRAEHDQQEELRADLAGPRATAVLLAALPLFGLLLGAVMGVEPLRVLLHSTAGLGCLLIGVLLELAGLAWVTAITRSAEKAATR